MSETEKKKRAGHRKKRRIAITVLSILLVLVTLATAAFGVALYKLNKTLYIDYTEEGLVDYQVHLKPNGFYEESVLPAGQSYVASLIDSVTAKFTYALETEANNVDYEYSYYIDAQLVVTDTATDVAIFNPIYTVKEKQTLSQNSASKLAITELVALDYAHYNALAESFVSTYELSGTECALVARMHVTVLSICEDFEEDTQNEYVVALSIPLTTRTVNVEISSSVPRAESKILACEKGFDRDLFVSAITHGSITDGVLLVALILVALLTRSTDITYAIKVKKLVNAYRSFIQQIKNPFVTDGYQILLVSTFNEMLEIRDTINAPVLMYENEDKTCTQFIIPTSTNLLYIFELKIADYDEIYGTPASDTTPEAEFIPVAEPVIEPVVEQPVVEEPVVEQPVVEQPVVEQPAVEDPVAEEPVAEEPALAAMASAVELPSEDEEGNAFGFGPKYDYSFEARLALADDEVKGYWRAIATFARSYGVKVARSWARERIYIGRNLFALVTFKGKKLALAFAKDPATADDKYHAMDMSAFKKFERTPMLMRISSPRKLKFATELLTELFEAAGLTNKKLDVKVEYVDHRTKAELLEAGLIRIENQ